ncbi:MAG: hypothetical protein AB7Q42_08645 [Acidimicrobiia bacterium]
MRLANLDDHPAIVIETDRADGYATVADLTEHDGYTFHDVYDRWDEVLGVAAEVAQAATTMVALAALGAPSPRPRQEFAARDATVDELAQAVPLVRFETLTLVRVGALRTAWFRLDPTGRNPLHFTVVFEDLERGVDALVSCDHHSWVNAYHEQ